MLQLEIDSLPELLDIELIPMEAMTVTLEEVQIITGKDGEQGPIGPIGPAGEVVYVVETYVHTQILASNEWIIDHPMMKFPSVVIVDSGENVIIGDIEYIDNTRVIVRFTSVFGGKAYLN